MPWLYNWNTRTDRDGYVAGYYSTTPIPITEASSTYSITNDEGQITFTLGTIYFVDGTLGGTTTTYNPTTRLSTGGSYTAYQTITAAIAAQASGNKTILVRSGTYTETNLRINSGTDNTHRYMICGYGQERPVIDGSSTSFQTFQPITNGTYLTIQRLKITDNYNCGFRSNATESYLNVIDIWFYNCAKQDVESVQYGDGNLYFLGSDNVWIYHCSSEHSDGHGYKLGDGVNGAVVEWSTANEIGYWPSYHFATRSVAHPTALDFPSDNTVGSPVNINCTGRYNVLGTSLFYSLQLRHTQNFDVHHNEIYSGIQFNNVSGCEARSLGGLSVSQCLLWETGSFGSFYSNYIHDPGKNEAGSKVTCIRATSLGAVGQSGLIYNNLLVGHDNQPSLSVASSNVSIFLGIYNNTIYAGTTNAYNGTVYNQYASADYKNNIIYITGNGQCAEFTAGTHTGNLYYAPAGSVGVTLGVGERNANPQFVSIPTNFYLLASSPAIGSGINLSSYFSTDILGSTRTLPWDIGAYKYISTFLTRMGRRPRFKVYHSL